MEGQGQRPLYLHRPEPVITYFFQNANEFIPEHRSDDYRICAQIIEPLYYRIRHRAE